MRCATKTSILTKKFLVDMDVAEIARERCNQPEGFIGLEDMIVTYDLK